MHDLHSASMAIDKIMKMKEKTGKNPEKVKVMLGAMLGSPEHFLELFSEMALGTELEGIKMEVEPVPVEAECACGFRGRVEVQEHVHFVRCPECGKVAKVLKGDEMEVI